jgi:integrase
LTPAKSSANSFEVIAREWERNIFPWLGSKPITDIMPKDILDCLRRIEDRGTIETAHRTLLICGQVFRYAVATSRITPDLRGALPAAKGEHFAAITESKLVAELLRAIDSYQGSFSAVCALKLAPLVFVRPGELRAAEWQHIDLESKEWGYFVSKTEVQIIVPLSTQAQKLLQKLKPLTGHDRFVFPPERNPRSGRCMRLSANTKAL